MKKIYLLLISFLLPLICRAVETVPYASDFKEWEIVNEDATSPKFYYNSDESLFEGTNWKTGILYSASGGWGADDWIISPKIYLEEGKEYVVRYWEKCRDNNNLDYSLYFSTQKKAQRNMLYSETPCNDSEWKRVEKKFSVNSSGEYYFQFYASVKSSNHGGLLYTGLEITEDTFTPSFVTDLAVEGDSSELKATLSWNLPTTDVAGEPLPEDAEFNNVLIYRDGELVATLEGNPTSWEDTAETGLINGVHKYEVAVTVNDAVSAKMSVVSQYVGTFPAFPIPWKPTLDDINEADFDLYFKTEKGSQSTESSTWRLSTNYPKSILFAPRSNAYEDDWIFMPKVKIEAPGIYRFSFTNTSPYAFNINLDIWIGEDCSSESMSKKLNTISRMPLGTVDFDFDFYIDTPGEYVIGMHAVGKQTSNGSCKFINFNIKEYYSIPVAATDLMTKVAGEEVELKWINPSLNSVDQPIETLSKVEVYRDDELIATLTEGINPGEESTYTDSPGVGAYRYNVIPVIGEHPSEDISANATSEWVGSKVQSIPFSYISTDKVLSRGFTAYNLNNDNLKWTLGEEAPILKLNECSSNDPIKERLVTLPLNFENRGYYWVRVISKGGVYKSDVYAGIVKESDPEMEIEKEVSFNIGSSIYTESNIIFIRVDEPGIYNLVFDYDWIIDNKNNTNDLTIQRIDVSYKAHLSSPVSELSVLPDEDGNLSAVVEWVNPTTSTLADSAPVISKAVISRNGEEVATVTEDLYPGEISQWIDEEVPADGRHKYSVAIYTPDGVHEEEAMVVKSPWIGQSAQIPYEQNDFSEWNFLNAEGAPNWAANTGVIEIDSEAADDWAISPAIKFEEGEYEISFTPYTLNSEATDYEFHLYFGQGVEIEDMTQKLATLSNMTDKENADNHLIYISAVDGAAPALLADEGDIQPEKDFINVPAGVGTLGFYAATPGSAGVRDFAIKKVVGTGVETIFESKVEGMVDVYDISGRLMAKALPLNALRTLEKGLYIIRTPKEAKRILVK